MNQFFVFEGIDGCGKDTILGELKNHFAKEDSLETSHLEKNFSKKIFENIFFTYEPSKESPEGQKLYQLIEQKKLFYLSKKEIFDFYLKDRFHHSKEILKKIHNQQFIFSSRYDLSSYAYQKEDNETFENAYDFFYQQHNYKKKNEIKQQQNYSLIPDITFFLKIEAPESLARIKKNRDFITEFETLKQLQTISKNYDEAIHFLQKKDNRKIVILDATLPILEIKQKVLKEIED